MARLPFEMDYLTDEIVQKAEKELGETEEVRKEALIQMRIAITEEQKLICPMDDNYLLEFLRARKFNVKRAFGLLQNYYHVKRSYPDIYCKPDLNGLKRSINDKIINMLPYRDHDGAVIMVIQLYNWKVNEIKFSSFVHSITCFLLLCVEIYPASQICGIKLIIDAKGMGLSYARYVSPRLLHLIGRGLTNCLPVRFRAIHCINQAYIVQYFGKIVSLVLSEKIKNRMIFHSNNESLHKYISPELLPKEYDGTLIYDNCVWIKKIDELEDKYLHLLGCGYKSKRDSKDGISS